MTKIELFIMRICCFFGLHEWHENRLDQVFYPGTVQCFWCRKRKVTQSNDKTKSAVATAGKVSETMRTAETEKIMKEMARLHARYTKRKLAWDGKLIWKEYWTNLRAYSEFEALRAKYRRLMWNL
jgi:hypothetical protein